MKTANLHLFIGTVVLFVPTVPIYHLVWKLQEGSDQQSLFHGVDRDCQYRVSRKCNLTMFQAYVTLSRCYIFGGRKIYSSFFLMQHFQDFIKPFKFDAHVANICGVQSLLLDVTNLMVANDMYHLCLRGAYRNIDI